jgi:hypothetical protein
MTTMTQRAQVWQDFASRALAAVLTARTVPLRVEEDFHFSQDLTAMIARYADAMTKEWAQRFDRTPKKPRKT